MYQTDQCGSWKRIWQTVIEWMHKISASDSFYFCFCIIFKSTISWKFPYDFATEHKSIQQHISSSSGCSFTQGLHTLIIKTLNCESDWRGVLVQHLLRSHGTRTLMSVVSCNLNLLITLMSSSHFGCKKKCKCPTMKRPSQWTKTRKTFCCVQTGWLRRRINRHKK